MTIADYSGVRPDGRWLEKSGWGLFSAGILLALFATLSVGAIVLIVVLYGLALKGM
jgi:hypothetical protein